MKQTAVEWLLNEFQEIHKDYGGLDLEWLKRFEQAKETEKQQIIDAFKKYRNSKFKNPDEIDWTKSGEQYYNKTFKNK